jgi:hypothetical protein
VPCCGGRRLNIAMHPGIAEALTAVLQEHPRIRYLAVTKSGKRLRRQSATALMIWFQTLCERSGAIGLAPCLKTDRSSFHNEGSANGRTRQLICADEHFGFAKFCRSKPAKRPRRRRCSTFLFPEDSSSPSSARGRGDEA